jgi:type VI protein secretion system component VasF
MLRKRKHWTERGDYRRRRRRREFWIVVSLTLCFAAALTWLLWAMS